MRKRLAILFAGSMLATLFAFGSQGAAHAATEGDPTTATEIGAQGWPTGCSTGPVNNGGYATCSSGNGGHYRAIIVCEDWFGQKVHRAAPNWISSGYSVVYCPPLTDRIANGIESRAY